MDCWQENVRHSAALPSETGESNFKKPLNCSHLKSLEMVLRVNSNWRNIYSRTSVKIWWEMRELAVSKPVLLPSSPLANSARWGFQLSEVTPAKTTGLPSGLPFSPRLMHFFLEERDINISHPAPGYLLLLRSRGLEQLNSEDSFVCPTHTCRVWVRHTENTGTQLILALCYKLVGHLKRGKQGEFRICALSLHWTLLL